MIYNRLYPCVKKQEVVEEFELAVKAAARHLSWLIGCAFGRWQRDCNPIASDDIYAELPEQPPAFNWSTAKSGLEYSGISDVDTQSPLMTAINENSDDNIVEKCLSLVGAKDWKTYLGTPSQFFASHYDQYSQNRRYAPIYWPLQTSSGTYTLWVYYHRLNKQTLYSCVNDFIEGQNGKLTQVEDDLNVLIGKSTRNSKEEKEFARLTDLASELRDFRDELLRIAKFWQPNRNDGVQITAAPLWKLFQYKAWQEKLKETWEKLEKGDYDWAHLACSIWPERVLRKCHQDRSLAIAHDVEDVFWHEVEVPVKRGKKATGGTKLEWQPKELTDAELNALIQVKIKEVNA